MERLNTNGKYVMDLCDNVLGKTALWHHWFDFLEGDAGRKLPVFAYYFHYLNTSNYEVWSEALNQMNYYENDVQQVENGIDNAGKTIH